MKTIPNVALLIEQDTPSSVRMSVKNNGTQRLVVLAPGSGSKPFFVRIDGDTVVFARERYKEPAEAESVGALMTPVDTVRILEPGAEIVDTVRLEGLVEDDPGKYKGLLGRKIISGRSEKWSQVTVRRARLLVEAAFVDASRTQEPSGKLEQELTDSEVECGWVETALGSSVEVKAYRTRWL